VLLKRILTCLSLLAIASAANAQWSSDPAVNLAVANAGGTQEMPKVAPTLDGGCYVSWYNGASGGDVRLQKLDAAGNEVFAHNGILVADLSFSWFQDYCLDVDAFGNALLTFRDDRGDGTQITAAKVSPAGLPLWGATGVQLTNTTDYVASPDIAATTDGGAVVAWTEGSAIVRLQKLDADGNPLWGTGVTISSETGAYHECDLHCSGTDAILSFTYTGALANWIYLLAQKFDSDGNPLWGASPITLFDAGSIQDANYPEFVLDGSGGAVFSWYDVSTGLQCYVQHVRADGTEAFPHNGSATSTATTRSRVSPMAAFNRFTNETFVFWEEKNRGQTRCGVYGQKFDASGGRQWTDEGVVIEPISSESFTNLRCLTEGTSAFVFWVQSHAFERDSVFGARLNSAGVIDVAPFSVASTPSGKSRMVMARSSAGFAVLAWSDTRADKGDIFVQNVNADGTLGSPTTGVPVDVSKGSELFLGAPWPNPASNSTRIEYRAAAPGKVALEIYDIRGRIVRAWSAGAGPRSGMVVWDGRDNNGARMACGVYFVRLKNGVAVRTARVVLIR